jgi:hypothetical protein
LLSDALKIFDFVYSAYQEHAPDDK